MVCHKISVIAPIQKELLTEARSAFDYLNPACYHGVAMFHRAGLAIILTMFCLFVLWLSFAACVTESRARGGSDLRTIAVTLGTRTIQASVAETVFSRGRGLLDWETISEDQGMLLDFETEGVYAIHMEGMKFPIDAVWIDGQGVIKLIYESIRPNSGLSYPSAFKCHYCLELKAGFCRKNNVAVGQTVKFGGLPVKPSP